MVIYAIASEKMNIIFEIKVIINLCEFADSV